MLAVARQNQQKSAPRLPPSQHTVFQNLDKDSLPHHSDSDDAFQRAATARVLAASTLIGLKVLAAHIDASRDLANSKNSQDAARNWTLEDVENVAFLLGILKEDLLREEQYHLIALALYLDRDSLEPSSPKVNETAGHVLVRALYPSWWGHAEHIPSHQRSPHRLKRGKTPPPVVDVWSCPKKVVDEWTQTLESYMLKNNNIENVRQNRKPKQLDHSTSIHASEDESEIVETHLHAGRRKKPLQKDQGIQTTDSPPFVDHYTQTKIDMQRKDVETEYVLDTDEEEYIYADDIRNRREQPRFDIDAETSIKDRARGRSLDSRIISSTSRPNLGAKEASHETLYRNRNSAIQRRHKPYVWSIPVKKKGVLGAAVNPDKESGRTSNDLKVSEGQCLLVREKSTRDLSFASIGFTEDSGVLSSVASVNETNIINIALDFLQGGFADKYLDLEALNEAYNK
ncbi:hypothetical protein BJ742DRAFT_792179 [Cladochytrium replicatum]|nr:hypothetical protein BJ742DRAFT_792179 [Cladochytrium replicatum]